MTFMDYEPEVAAADPAVRAYIEDAAGGNESIGIFPRLEMPAVLMDAQTKHRRNGATYIVVFEVPHYNATPIGMMDDGFTMTFTPLGSKPVVVGHGAYLASSGQGRDPEGGKILKCRFQFAKSEVASASSLHGLIADDQVRGTLLLENRQGTFDLTARA